MSNARSRVVRNPPRLLELCACEGGATPATSAPAGTSPPSTSTAAALARNPADVTVKADALDYLAEHGHEYDAIHASFPCQRWTANGANPAASKYPDLITPGRELLNATGLPWVMENVPKAPLRRDLILCGTMFGLTAIDTDGTLLHLDRHRVFESNVPLPAGRRRPVSPHRCGPAPASSGPASTAGPGRTRSRRAPSARAATSRLTPPCRARCSAACLDDRQGPARVHPARLRRGRHQDRGRDAPHRDVPLPLLRRLRCHVQRAEGVGPMNEVGLPSIAETEAAGLRLPTEDTFGGGTTIDRAAQQTLDEARRTRRYVVNRFNGTYLTAWPDATLSEVHECYDLRRRIAQTERRKTASAPAVTMQDALDAIRALADALDRTQANFVSAVCGRPVRDMCETLAENHAAALKGARLMPMPNTLMRQL
jgi:hypothetical protein